ncbi:MAG: hypothetical protein NUV31_10975, partial [Dehalococcoidales bacterium]|nr:hypothetical protein [Dehalococcoidales bacterium]
MKIRGNTIKQNWHVFTGISIISAGMLAYEIILTRILSVILSYHYVFAVISLAMLGLGLGAILNHLMQSKLSRLSTFNRLALLASLLAASIPLSLLIIFGISSTQSLSSNLFIYLLIIIIPFCSAGILFAELFRSYTESSSWLYGFDLLGASLGAAGAIVVMNIFGGVKSAAIISSLIWLAALLYTMTSLRTLINRNWQSIIGGLLIFSLAGTIFINLRIADIPVMNQEKEMVNIISNSSSPAKIVETRWNAFGRTDLVAYESDPSRMAIFIDGTAGAYMYRFNGDFNNPDPSVKNLQTSFPGYLALSIMPENGGNSALIIGPGGGMDVLLAQMAGIKQITAVEVNQAAVDIVRQYGQYNGHLYEAENVSVIVDEGRSFLKRQKMQYDIIMLSIPLTKTSRSPEGFALTENFLFTTDSINDYLNHLTDNGRLIVVAHNEIEIIRLLSLSLAAINQNGTDSFAAMQRVAVIGWHHYPVFILKKTPFNQAEAISLHRS